LERSKIEAGGGVTRSEFFRAIDARLDAGQRAYGNKSFSRDPAELLEEIKLELLDICGWSYVALVRIGEMERALEASK
jgi:hypothetical protein